MPSMIATKELGWDKRIARAGHLAEGNSGVSEVLNFYRRILEFQQQVYTGAASRPAPVGDGGFRERLDSEAALKHLPGLLSLVQNQGPSKLAQVAADLRAVSQEQHRARLTGFLRTADSDDTGEYSFFARALYQPLAEHLATMLAPGASGFSASGCPVCGAAAQVAVLRPEGDGGKRFLICSFCMTEWEFRRILCPVCGEQDYAKLPRYTAESVSAVRVEACETCHYYLKSVDLTVDGHAVPVVDDVATAPLDVWASDHGFQKISLNLMGF